MAREGAARDAEDELRVSLPPTEQSLFIRMKAALGGREAWLEVLKCFELHAEGILNRQELFTLLGDILGHSDRTLALLEDVKSLLNPKRSTAATEEDSFQSLPVAELDLSKQPTNGRSYRQLPAGFPMQACSERSRWE